VRVHKLLNHSTTKPIFPTLENFKTWEFIMKKKVFLEREIEMGRKYY